MWRGAAWPSARLLVILWLAATVINSRNDAQPQMKSRQHQPFIKDNSQNVGFLNSGRVVYLPLSTNLLAGHLLLLTFAFALRWPSSYVVLACSNGDTQIFEHNKASLKKIYQFLFTISGLKTMQSLKISPCVSIPPNTNSNISLSFSSAVSAVLSPDIKQQITEDCINFLFYFSICLKHLTLFFI